MSTRKPSKAFGPAAHGASGPGALNDLPRQHLAATAQACCAVFRGFEAIRRIQHQAAHEAFTHHQELAKQLEQPCSPSELVALQAELLRVDVEGATQYWQQLASAMLEMQRDLLGSATSAVQKEAEQASRAMATDGPANGLAPFFFQPNGAQRAATNA